MPVVSVAIASPLDQVELRCAKFMIHVPQCEMSLYRALTRKRAAFLDPSMIRALSAQLGSDFT